MKAVITFGLPSAGKTTYLNNRYGDLLTNEDTGVIIISADDIKKTLPSWDEKDPSKSHQESVRIARDVLFEHVERKYPYVIFDSGSINTKYSRNIFKRIKENGYEIELVYLDTPIDICLQRNKSRAFKVPEENIHEKEKEKTEAFLALIPYVDCITFIRNS
jgi:predicted kinase